MKNTDNHTINSVLFPFKKGSSGWQDSNLRPPRPKRGAITGLRYTPKKAERPGFEPGQHLRVDRLAICSITTLAPLLFYMNFANKIADANLWSLSNCP